MALVFLAQSLLVTIIMLNLLIAHMSNLCAARCRRYAFV